RRGHELDPAAVRRADHSHARIARAVELHGWLLRDPIDESLDVAPLEVGTVALDRPARLPETARVPGEHVVTRRVQRVNAEIAEQAVTRTGGVHVSGLAPTRTLEHGRRRRTGGEVKGKPV